MICLILEAEGTVVVFFQKITFKKEPPLGLITLLGVVLFEKEPHFLRKLPLVSFREGALRHCAD